MKIKTFQTKKIGILIQENSDKTFSVWCDEKEGGYAHDENWKHCSNCFLNYPLSEFMSYKQAYDWVIENYGEIDEI